MGQKLARYRQQIEKKFLELHHHLQFLCLPGTIARQF